MNCRFLGLVLILGLFLTSIVVADNLTITMLHPTVQELDGNAVWFMFNLSSNLSSGLEVNYCYVDMDFTVTLNENESILTYKDGYNVVLNYTNNTYSNSLISNLTNTSAPLNVTSTPITRIISYSLPYEIKPGPCWICNETNTNHGCEVGSPYYGQRVCWYPFASDTRYKWNVSCVDINNNTYAGGNGELTFNIPSIISGPSVVKTTSSATISWTLDEETTNHLIFKGQILNQSKTKNAQFVLSDLSVNTPYTYELVSCDSIGEQQFYRNSSTDFPHCVRLENLTFTTDSISSGGSTQTINNDEVVVEEECVENWRCSSWSICSDELQSRTCVDNNDCGSNEDKPETLRDCIMPSLNAEVNLGVSNSESAGDYEELGIDSARNLITGQVTGDGSEEDTNGWTWVLVTIAGLVAIVGGVTTYNTHFK
jgi:hypothetical protein